MLVSPSGISQIKESVVNKVFFGHQPTPELLSILSVYLVQGILGLARLAVSFFLKDDLSLSPAQVAALMGVAALPWVVKPVFGLFSDGLPIFGYRRRPYLVISGLLGTSAWLCLATVVDTPLQATAAIALSSFSVAMSDVIVDSVVVERVRKESVSTAGSLQSLCWAASSVGGLLTAYLGGYLLERVDTQTIFAITALFPLIVSAVACLIAEQPIETNTEGQLSQTKNQIKQVWQAMKQKAIWMPALFLFLWQATPSSDSGFFYFTTNELGFGPEFLGRVRLVSSLASLVGIWVFQRYLKTVPFRTMFGWTICLSTGLGMTTLLLVTHVNRDLGIGDRWFSLGDSLILTVMGQIAFMPVLVLAARLCPPGIEATLFALLMSIVNLAGLVSHETGALLTHFLGVTERNFDNLWLLVTIANLSSLLPLPLLSLLPPNDRQGESVSSQTASTSSAVTPQPVLMAEFAGEVLPSVED
ncbi:folate/biopterin family MFS transporter [Merismopedia glauca]|uniref:Folate/biopterin family MFS transporter n=1 Tax=Merismopedia glauca CCAP 1448/3 TaxID=1296344 RepID=A0A2T1C0T4_9CYAN|nr:folate/biopterin family MFS transporter [Merismopedia glauca]PSB01879.1 folate/biopterin family MFS transporter [Merismopedia glauca CCAP 1448/3]